MKNRLSGSAAIFFSLVASTSTLFFFWGTDPTEKGWYWFALPTGLAALFIGYAIWHFFLVRPAKFSYVRAFWAGTWVALLSHPISLYMFIVAHYIAGVRSSLGERTMNPLEAIWGSLVFTLPSLVFAGWFTLPLGGLIGILWIYFYNKGLFH